MGLASLYLVTRPMATPATGALIGTPASINARLPPHTVAIELEPVSNVNKNRSNHFEQCNAFSFRSHTIRFQHLRRQTNGKWMIVRDNGHDSFFRQCSMTDFSASNRTHTTNFACCVWWKLVMQKEIFGFYAPVELKPNKNHHFSTITEQKTITTHISIDDIESNFIALSTESSETVDKTCVCPR